MKTRPATSESQGTELLALRSASILASALDTMGVYLKAPDSLFLLGVLALRLPQCWNAEVAVGVWLYLSPPCSPLGQGIKPRTSYLAGCPSSRLRFFPHLFNSLFFGFWVIFEVPLAGIGGTGFMPLWEFRL